MRCLCCNKELPSDSKCMWHKKCIQSFFGTNELPDLELTKKKLDEIALNNVFLGYTVPGVQKKLSLNLSSNSKKKRLTLVNYPSGYIY